MRKAMRMIPGVLALLIVMTGAAWGAVQDPVHDFPDFYKIPEDYEGYYYYFNRYDYNFNYQLRDVSGVRDGHTIAGAQWFATVYENALWNNIYRKEIVVDQDERLLGRSIYRRTLGGEMPEIPMVTSADLLYDFESVYLNEPEPYPAATINDYWWIYSHDLYPDPVETLCLVIPEGRGEFNVSLANHYARHFPYWWKVDPHLGPNVPVNPANYTVPVYTLSGDVSGDAILDTSKTVVGYVDRSRRSIFDSTHTDVLYTVSTVSDDTKVLNASGDTVYKLVTSRDITYVYNPSGYCVYRVSNGTVYGSSFGRDVMEDVRMSAENYAVSVNPNTPQRVAPTQSMTARIRLTAEDPENYGSTLGHIAFRQSASFDTGYTGWRESIQIPIVVANVHDGPASDPGNELYFDMMVFDRTPSFDVVSSRDIYIINDIVNRIKFRWGVETDMTQDLGTFYMMGDTPVYHLETRVTNRTGTRYRLQRYDMIGNPGYSNPLSADTTGVRYTFRDIRPDRWQYDLTPDLYGSLPAYFQLDAHSQIAPGLVTVYKNRVGSGYNTLDTTYGTSESFRLYPFAEATHHDLRLSYRRVGGMTSTGGSTGRDNRWSVRGFAWHQFADVVQNDDQTERELEVLMGKPASLGTGSVSAADTYIRSSALNAFEIKTPVPKGLVSMDVVAVVVSEDASGDIVESRDVPGTIAVQPMRVRLRIPRQEQMLVGRWAELDAAPDNKALLNRFLRFATIWMRSDNAYERDSNLFTAISNRGVDPTECVQAFLYDDELYLDFMILLADAKSRNEGRTAYLETFRDDGIPYILIGDGAADGVWKLSLYVDSNGANPDWGYTSGDLTSRDKSGSDSGGGGCSAGLAGIAAAAVAGAFFLRRRGY